MNSDPSASDLAKSAKDSTVSAVKSAKDSTVSAVKSGVEWTDEKGRELTEEPSTFSKVQTAVSSAASRVGDFVSETYQSITGNPTVQEVSDGTKKKLDEVDQELGHEATSLYSRMSGSSSKD
jgi:phage-related protein